MVDFLDRALMMTVFLYRHQLYNITQNPNTCKHNTDTTPSDPPDTILDEDKPESKLQKFSVTADKTVVKEGDFITYTITTQNVPDNLIFNYKLFGNGITS